MLLCFPDLLVEEYNENELDQRVLNWYSDYVVAFFDSIKLKVLKFNNEDEIEPIIARFSEDAKKEWKRIFNSITEQQNSDEENEYMKSMLPKQKSYIPRFALLINTLNWYNSSGLIRLEEIQTDSILAAEKLSKYFIAMSKKIKINSAEVNDIKKFVRNNDSKTSFEKFKELYTNNPDINKTELAEILGVSRKTIHKYAEKCNPSVTGVTHKKST
jgi:DNA-binding XRE family transcriptional regulator